ncbi:MAG: 50S ribosomal protein L3 [Candidatus Paceibacterota bacterium]
MKFILGKKIGMTEIFAADGKRTPVTLIEAGPCQITQLKTKKTDGYVAVQLGFCAIVEKRIKKGQVKKPFRFIREFRLGEDGAELNAGDKIIATVFSEGDIVKVAGLSKGKGFQGVVKKDGFKGRHTTTHGTKHELRNVGSVGMGGASIRKGRKMPGRMGVDRVTMKSAKIIKIDSERNILAVKGSVPGNKGTLLEIRGK